VSIIMVSATFAEVSMSARADPCAVDDGALDHCVAYITALDIPRDD
jgi:hypothetical protein